MRGAQPQPRGPAAPPPRARRWPLLALAASSFLAGLVAVLAVRGGTAAPIPRAALAARPVAARTAGPGAPARGDRTDGITAAAEPPSAGSGAVGGPTRRWQARAAGEWQGMLVDLDSVPPCDASAVCGLARACVGGRCVACERDGQCGAGEVCVLDHCLFATLAGCRSRRDCPSGELCILGGYSSLPRGNEEMRSVCVGPASGAGTQPPAPAAPAPDPRPSLADDELVERARAAAR